MSRNEATGVCTARKYTRLSVILSFLEYQMSTTNPDIRMEVNMYTIFQSVLTLISHLVSTGSGL